MLAIGIWAGGRHARTPENGLALDYLARARKAGRPLGFSGFTLTEHENARAPRKGPSPTWPAPLIALDEGGAEQTSAGIASALAAWRDKGAGELHLAIGGADGLPVAAKASALATWSFGRQTWPHLLVRVMLAEQLYRAMTILSGHPYHRG